MVGAKRRIFIGDIQGCLDELRRLLDAVRFDPAADALEPVGDLVNRGPDSPGVLRLMRDLGAGGVLGNHDLHLLHVARGERQTRAGDTIDSVLRAPDRDELLAWLASKPFVRVFSDVVLVHAGLHPAWAGRDLERELALPTDRPHANIAFATRARWCDADGREPDPPLDPPPVPGFAPWFEHYRDARSRTIVFGHWARLGLVNRPGFRGLDTGCVWGGRLTAWIAEEDRLVHVPAGRAYASPDD